MPVLVKNAKLKIFGENVARRAPRLGFLDTANATSLVPEQCN
jgi:hypothetical protein